jgi:hypothetical protein
MIVEDAEGLLKKSCMLRFSFLLPRKRSVVNKEGRHLHEVGNEKELQHPQAKEERMNGHPSGVVTDAFH